MDSIQVTYRHSDGTPETGGYFGGRGGVEATVEIDVENGEEIIGMFGRSGSALDNVGFVTNHGKVFGPYGGGGGGVFTVNNCSLRGVFGRANQKMDSLGFYCGA